MGSSTDSSPEMVKLLTKKIGKTLDKIFRLGYNENGTGLS